MVVAVLVREVVEEVSVVDTVLNVDVAVLVSVVFVNVVEVTVVSVVVDAVMVLLVTLVTVDV